MEVLPVWLTLCRGFKKYGSVTCSDIPCVEDLSEYGSVTCFDIPCVEDLSKYGSVTCSGIPCCRVFK